VRDIVSTASTFSNAAPTLEYSVRSVSSTSSSFGSLCSSGGRPTETTFVTSARFKVSSKAPCPIIPDAPKRMTFMCRKVARLRAGHHEEV
jgi:hypothetical protein